MALLALSATASAAGSTRVLVDHIDTELAPEFRVYVDVLNAADRPIRKLETKDIAVLLDGERYEDELGLQVFKKSEEAVAFVLLVNNYMGYKSVFEEQKKGLQAFVRGMRSKDIAAIVSYADKAVPLVDFTSDKEELLQAISTIPAPEKPQEVFFDAVVAALDRFPEDQAGFPRRRGLVMISDALDQRLEDRAYLANRIKKDIGPKAKALGVKFYALGYSIESKKGLKLMAMLAKNMGGSFREVRESELNRTGDYFTQILDRVYGQYIVSFVTDDLDEEETHTLQINVDHKGNRVESAPEEFSAPPIPSWWTWWKILLIVVGSLLFVGVIFLIIRAIRNRGDDDDPDDPDDDDVPSARDCPMCGEEMPPEWRACEYCLETPHVAELKVVGGAWDGFIYIITDEVTTIGSRDGDILIEDSTVSGRHAGIKVDDMKFELADFDSTNGTYVNGKQITKQFLRDGDVVKLGGVDLKFTLA